MKRLNALQLAFLYALLFNIQEDPDAWANKKNLTKPIDQYLVDHKLPDSEQWVPDENGCPTNLPAWAQNAISVYHSQIVPPSGMPLPMMNRILTYLALREPTIEDLDEILAVYASERGTSPSRY